MPPSKDFDLIEDKSTLKRLYHDRGMTLQEIADLEGCADTTVLTRMEKYGIERRTRGTRKVENKAEWGREERLAFEKSIDKQRGKALDRDGYRCVSCGASQELHRDVYQQGLNVHHVEKASTFENPKEANELSNLLTLCEICHGKYERGVHGPLAGIRWRDFP